LFVSPDRQGHGIGNELLKRTWGHAKKNGATNKALITFTFNTVSQGLYMRHGMFPRFPIYIFSVARERLAGRLQGAQLRSVPIENTALQMENLVRIDVQALGVSREKHHRYLASDSATRGVLLYARDDCVGYVYVSSDGHIGPLAVARPDALGAAFGTSLSLAVGGLRAGVGVHSRHKRVGSDYCRRARHADHNSDGANVDARLRGLGVISAPKSGFHVIAPGTGPGADEVTRPQSSGRNWRK
jgi:hypothetical protein